MKVHVLTHTVIESDAREVYGLVQEELERQRELGTVQAVAIQHGAYKLPEMRDGGAPYVTIDDEGNAWLEKTDDGVDESECCNLAASAIAAAETLGKA